MVSTVHLPGDVPEIIASVKATSCQTARSMPFRAGGGAVVIGKNHIAGNADEKRRNAIFSAVRIDGDDSRET